MVEPLVGRPLNGPVELGDEDTVTLVDAEARRPDRHFKGHGRPPQRGAGGFRLVRPTGLATLGRERRFRHVTEPITAGWERVVGSVQALRAAAALAVVAYHALQWCDGGFDVGRAGVDV